MKNKIEFLQDKDFYEATEISEPSEESYFEETGMASFPYWDEIKAEPPRTFFEKFFGF